MEIAPATAPHATVFRLKHSDKVIDCSGASLSPLLLPSSGSPNQLWSKFKGVSGQWFINRGTGAYLEVENGVVRIMIEAPYEWNVQEQGTSVRLETPQKMLLKATQQKVELSPNANADTLFVIDYLPDPTLSIGSEDYIHSPEHTCVTNHVFNAVNAINAIIHILEKPDNIMPPGKDKMVLQYTPEHFAQFKARGNEATQNFDFAGATVASWFLIIAAKIATELKNHGILKESEERQKAEHAQAEALLNYRRKTHQGTLAAVKAQQTEYDNVNTKYNEALVAYNAADRAEKLAKVSYESPSSGFSMSEPLGLLGSDVGTSYTRTRATRDLEAATVKKASRELEFKEAGVLLDKLKTKSTEEEAEIDGLTRAASKLTQLQAHHKTLTDLQISINDCRTHLADTLAYKVSDASSLTMVRQRVRGIVEVLQKDKDFQEPMKILDRAALDELVKKIPDISRHAIAGK